MHVVIYAHYACVADCADAMADAWEDTARWIQDVIVCMEYSKVFSTVMWGLHGIVHIGSQIVL